MAEEQAAAAEEQVQATEAAAESTENTSAESAGATEAEGKQAEEKSNTLLSDDGGEASDGNGSDDSEGEQSRAPETYEFQPPEGVEISEEAQSRIDNFVEEIVRPLDLTQEQYQGLMEKIVEQEQFTKGQEKPDPMKEYAQRMDGWAESVRSDKEIGGDNLDANVAVAKQALKQFGSEDLTKLIEAPSQDNPEGLGLGNHPEFLRFMYRVGKSMGDGEMITGNGGQAARTQDDALRKMFPTMYSKQ